MCAGLWRVLRNCKVFHCVTDILPLCRGCPGSSMTSARLICLRTTKAMKPGEGRWDVDKGAGEEINFIGCFLWTSIIYVTVCVSDIGKYCAKLCFCVCVFAFASDNESAKNQSGAILLLITELMTYYAPVDMQHDTHTHTRVHTYTHHNGQVCFGAHTMWQTALERAWQWDGRLTMPRIRINTHAARQQLTRNLIKLALMKSLLQKRRGKERGMKGGGEKEDKVAWIDDAH